MATFVTMLHAMAIGPLIPEISADLGSSAALLGQIVTLSTLLAAGLGLVAGPLIDRFGHRRALVLSVVAVAASALGMGLAPDYPLLLAAALAGAFGRAIVQPVALVIAGKRYSGDRQRRAVSWVMTGMTGAVVAGVPALTFTADVVGWRMALVGLAALTGALAMALARATARDAPAAAPPEGTQATWHRILDAYRPLLAHRPTLALLASVLIGNSAVSMMAIYLGAFLHERYGYTSQQVGWAYLAAGATMFAGTLIAGGRVGALPQHSVIMLSRIAIGLVVFAAYSLPISALGTMGMLGVQGLAMGIGNIALVMLLIRESPAGRATTMTLNAVVISLSSALGSMLGGLLLAFVGFAMIGVAALLLSGVAATLAWLARTPATAEMPLPAAPA